MQVGTIDGRRIVACVNACRGVDTETLERGDVIRICCRKPIEVEE